VSPRLLVLEPYYGGSHRTFLDGLLERLGWRYDLLTLPARKWKWRMAGSAVTFADEVRTLHAGGARWDACLASTFVDLPAFLGLARGALHAVPAAVYFHENQLAYPNRYERDWDFQYPLVNVRSALAADACVFNSAYNRDSFLNEIPRFLGRFPDHPLTDVVPRIRSRALVLPPPFDPTPLDAATLERGSVPRVVWPHRWDHDKAPEAFFDAVEALAAEGLAFEVAVAGQAHDDVRDAFETRARALGDRLVTLGGLESRESYAALLRTCDVAVSTASHEFFGLAMAEASYAGCFPLVPDRLAYPEVYPESFRYRSAEELVGRLRRLLTGERPAPGAAHEVGERYTFERLMPRYQAFFDGLVNGSPAAVIADP
jgi:glycosyltransferase involved in cell wall biosynthesis